MIITDFNYWLPFIIESVLVDIYPLGLYIFLKDRHLQ